MLDRIYKMAYGLIMAEGLLPRGNNLVRITALIVFMALLAMQAYAAQDRRVALVIGNSKYQHTSALINPKNDADALAAKLEELHFDVVKGIDLDQDGMQRTIGEFATKLTQADVGLFFYAGHGLQVAGENYLLPIDGKLTSELDLQFKAVKLNLLLRIMEGKNRTSIVLLDACRDNPLAEELSRSLGGTRGGSIGRGLARVETGVGTYIGFSTQPGNVALDGDGQNSPFASALLKRIDTPGLDIEALMRRVRQDVRDETRGTQTPWGNSSLVGSGFVFKPKEVKQAALEINSSSRAESAARNSGNDRESQVEFAYWDAIKDSSDPSFLQAYLDRYPNGLFVALARLKLDSLQKSSGVKKQSRGSGNSLNGSADIAYWDFIKDKSNVAYFESYVTRYPSGIFVDIAKLKIEELGGVVPKASTVEGSADKEEAEKLEKAKAEEARIKAETAAEEARKKAKAEAEEARKKAEAEARAKAEARRLTETPTQQPSVAQSQAQQNRQLTEIAYWNSILNQSDPALFRAYLERYPDGTFASIAKFKIGTATKRPEAPANQPKAENSTVEKKPESKEVKVAKLETPDPEPAPKAVEPELSKRDLAKAVQRELNRVGCNAGKVDGLWGKGSIRALRRYEKHLNVSLESVQPTSELYEQLQNVEARICPLECGVRQVESNGKCVAKTCASNEILNSKGRCVAKPKVAEPKKSRPSKRQQAAKPAPQQPQKSPPKAVAKRQPSGCGTCIIDPADNTVSERVCGRKYVEAKARGWCGRSVKSKRTVKRRATTRRKSARNTSSGKTCGRCVVDPADNTVAERLCGRRYIDAKGRGWCN